MKHLSLLFPLLSLFLPREKCTMSTNLVKHHLLSPLLSPPSLLSAVFTSNKLLVVVSEMYGDEREALDIVPVITTALLEEHQLVTGIIVVVDPGTIPINSRGEKQHVHLRDSFLADEVDPIYVAYNL